MPCDVLSMRSAIGDDNSDDSGYPGDPVVNSAAQGLQDDGADPSQEDPWFPDVQEADLAAGTASPSRRRAARYLFLPPPVESCRVP